MFTALADHSNWSQNTEVNFTAPAYHSNWSPHVKFRVTNVQEFQDKVLSE